nr:hypothetical protein [uncultured Brevundimonas sp.]
MLETEGASFGEDVVYRVIDANLAAGDVDAARASFEDIEPIEQLLGAKPVSDLSDEGSLMEWASRALAFRPPAQFLQMIGRLVESEGIFRAVDVKAICKRLTARILGIVETDTAQQVRLQFLEAAAEAARDRGVELGWDRLDRWRAELPRPRSGSSPEDPFFHARKLDEVAHLITAPSDHPWNASRAFARIAPREGYEAAREFLDRFPSLLSDKRVLKTIGDLALEAGDHAAATSHRDALRALARDRDYYDRGWSRNRSCSPKTFTTNGLKGCF